MSVYLERDDFHSVILFKVYEFMKSITSGNATEVATKRITNNFDRFVSEGNYYDNYNISFYGRATPIYSKSTLRKLYHTISKPFVRITQNEINALEQLLYYFGDNIINISDGEAFDLGRNRNDNNFNIRPKLDQLRLLNELFCNMGNRITNRLVNDVSKIEESSGLYTNNPVLHAHGIPKGSISDFLIGHVKKGGRRKITKKSRNINKRKNKHNKTKHRKTKTLL
jgi:hypothetical protein